MGNIMTYTQVINVKTLFSILVMMLIMVGSFIILPQAKAQGFAPDSCRATQLANGNLGLQECNSTRIKRLFVHRNGDIWIDTYVDQSNLDNLWCSRGPGGQFLLHRNNQNVDTIYALLLNAHEKQRPITVLRFFKTEPGNNEGGQCKVHWVMSDL